MSHPHDTFFKNLPLEFVVKETFGVGMDQKSGLTKFFKYTGYATRNEYKMMAGDQELGLIQEQKTPSLIPYDVKKAFLKGRRALTLCITDTDETPVLYLKRPFYLLVSTTVVLDSRKQVVGYIWRRLDPVFRKYDLLTKNKKLIGFIKSPILLKHWDFPVLNPQQKEIGGIKADWTLKSFMTYREILSVKYKEFASYEEKMMIFATAMALSLDLYE